MPRRHAWQLLLMMLAWGVSAPLAGAAEGRPPYVGYITADHVDARSGPGEEYYATMRLGRRDRVEVYRHDPGGWFAVRPPQHSFSWVSGEFVRRTGDTGEVIGDRVIVRVGSQLDNTRDVIQVRLNRGEQVQILGSREFDDGAGPRVWFQIAPPPGEFRWVHGRYVSSQPLEPERAAPQPTEPQHAGPRPNEPAHADDGPTHGDNEPLREAEDRGRPSRAADAMDRPRDDQDYADERSDREADDAEREELRRAKPQREESRSEDEADETEPINEAYTPTVRVSRRRPADEADSDDYESDEGRERYSDRQRDRESDEAYDPDSRAARRERARRDRLRAAAEAEAAEARLEAERDRADPNRAERERAGAALDRAPSERSRDGAGGSRGAEAGAADHEHDPADRDEASDSGTWRTRGGRRRDSGDQSAEARPGAATDERFQAEIDELDLELSAMVAQEASEWNFTNLRARGEAMLTRGQTALERGRVRRVLTKLERFADIKQRLDSAANIAADTRRLNAPLAAAPSQSRGPHMRPEFDGVGRLARVQSDRAGVPAFALTDTSGAVRYYVTPSPGTNLQHYVGQEVGINGTLGFLPELNTQHVTARRVESITGDRTLMR